MEEWQKTYIGANLSDLVENTSCTTKLKVGLRELNLISAEEENRLGVFGSSQGAHYETRELYRILQTRIGGYEALKEVLDKTNQTRAWQILQNGTRSCCKSGDESTSTHYLLDLSVEISGRATKLREVFPKFNAQHGMEALLDCEINREYGELIRKPSEPLLMLDGNLPSLDAFYIPRLISNRLRIDPKVFRMPCQEVFVFKGVERSHLKQLVMPNVIRSSTSQRYFIESRHIHLDDDEDWDDLVTVSKAPLHLVAKEGDDFVLQTTTDISGVLRDNTFKEHNKPDAYISEKTFVEQLLKDNEKKGALVCDIPGMGKTWLMYSVARLYREIADKSFTYFIHLPLFSKYLHDCRNASRNAEALQFILSYANKSTPKLTSLLLLEHAKDNGYEIVFVMDGFDEVRDTEINKTTAFLRYLNNNDQVRLIISSRPNMRKHLEETFKVVSYDILPFGRQEQIEAIVNKWRQCVATYDLDMLKVFARKCVEDFKLIQQEETSDILGVPLRCYLLAVVNESHAHLICRQGRQKPLELDKVAAVVLKSVSNLFEKFVEVSVAKVADLHEHTPELNMRLSNFHTHKALELLFPDIAKAYLTYAEVDQSSTDHVLKVGMMSYNYDLKLDFIHRSISEYFAGLFFAELWMNLLKYEEGFTKIALMQFIEDVLSTTDINFGDCMKEIRLKKFSFAKTSNCVISKFNNLSVLWFMNSVLIQRLNFNDIFRPTWFSGLQSSTRQVLPSANASAIFNEKDVYHKCKNHLKTTAYKTLIACIDYGLKSLFTVVIQLIHTLFEPSEKHCLILPASHQSNSHNYRGGMALLLSRVAVKGCPVNVHELIHLLEDSKYFHFAEMCQRYPKLLVSPLEIAIQRNDMDMAQCFIDRMEIPWERRFLRCLLGKHLTDAAIQERVKIMQMVVGKPNKLVSYLSTKNLSQCLRETGIDALEVNVRILTVYSVNRGINLMPISVTNKRLLLRLCLKKCTEDDITKLQKLIFAPIGLSENLVFGRQQNLPFYELVAKEAALLQIDSDLTTNRELYIARSISNPKFGDKKSSEIVSCRTESTLQRSTNDQLSMPISEMELMKRLCDDKNIKGALICAVPGMGKTALMRSIARQVVENANKAVVFFIRLSEFSAYLATSNENSKNSEVIQVVLKQCCSSQIIASALFKHLTSHKYKKMFFFDGFDEIKDEFVEITTEFLKLLQTEDNVRLIISSSLHMQPRLEKSFHVISYNILPFDREQQISAIVGHWRQNIPKGNMQKLTRFARCCVEGVSQIQHEETHEFLGIPFRCYLLSMVNEKLARDMHKTNVQDEVKPFASIYDLYVKLVHVSMAKVALENQGEPTPELTQKIRNYHTYKALELLFPEIAPCYSANIEVDPSLAKLVTKLGTMRTNSNLKLEFVSISLAEYFVGIFFVEFWENIMEYSAGFRENISVYFIQNVMAIKDRLNVLEKDSLNQFIEPLKHNKSGFANLGQFRLLWDFKQATILRFMNGMAEKKQFWKYPNWLKNIMAFLRMNMKQHVSESAFLIMIACIDERWTNIFSLYVHILISCFDLQDRVDLLIPHAIICQNVGYKGGAALLLCRVAASKNPDNVVELFNLFGDSKENFFSVLCQQYPQQYLSPLEVAIKIRDVDMTLFFRDKVILPFGRLFLACVAVDPYEELTSLNLDIKLKIMEIVLGSSDQVLDFLRTDNLYCYGKPANMIPEFAFQLLVNFLEGSKSSITSITNENKTWILESCLCNCNDEEIVNLLLTLYGKTDYNKVLILNFTIYTFTADIVLDFLDLVGLRSAFSSVQLNFLAFPNCLSLEILKVLIVIQPDFSSCNSKKWNYLHVAASTLKIDWVKYLIYSGYEVDQLDVDGCTPLLCVFNNRTNKPQSLLAMTRLLVENGANVYAKDRQGRNIAHLQFTYYLHADSNDLFELVSYFLENGYYQLWEMRDYTGNSPIEALIKDAGKNSLITTKALRLLESYSVVSTK